MVVSSPFIIYVPVTVGGQKQGEPAARRNLWAHEAGYIVRAQQKSPVRDAGSLGRQMAGMVKAAIFLLLVPPVQVLPPRSCRRDKQGGGMGFCTKI